MFRGLWGPWPWVLALSLVLPAASAAFPRGHVFLAADFEGTNAAPAGSVFDSGFHSAHAIRIERTEGASRGVTLNLPAEAMRGHTVRVAAQVRAEGVGAKPQPWNGIKCMLVVEMPEGKVWPQAELGVGTFDWKQARVTTVIPTNAQSVHLFLGLENVAGRVWFDDVAVAVRRPPVSQPAARVVAGPPEKGHALPRLRGAMVSPRIDEAALETLGRDWNANLIRWQMIRHGRAGETQVQEKYDAWLQDQLAQLDRMLPVCARFGIRVALDLHSPFGGKPTVSGYVGSDDGLFTNRLCQQKFADDWRRIAERYKGNTTIWGFDLANEPVEDELADDCDDWNALAARAAAAVRAADPARTLIIEPARWGGPAGFRDLVPLDLTNVVYSVHMYEPGAFTHQGVHGEWTPIAYPGPISGRDWDRAALEAALKPVIDFQARYGVHIYVGEFSAIRWAPGDSARAYLADVVDVFERQGWDWSYHAFREWDGWSVEHDGSRTNRQPAAIQTPREKLLREWFSQNRK